MGTAAMGLVLIGVGHYQGSLLIVAMLPVLGAAASWACGNIIVKKIGAVQPLALVVWGSWAALVAFALTAVAMYGADGVVNAVRGISVKGLMGVLFLAYVSSMVGYTAWGVLLSRYPAGKVTPFALLVPVVALLVGYLLLNERLGLWHWGGMALVMGGDWCAMCLGGNGWGGSKCRTELA